ncbi:MAG: M1 family peptidase, partial [Nitrosopumilaceae archaeon]
MDVIPNNYELVFEPDLTKFTFEGKEKITINCKKSIKTIAINCAEIKIKSCKIESNKKSIPSSFKTYEKSEELKITLKEKIKGIATIYLEFQGTLNDR